MSEKNIIQKQNIGNAGEYYLAARLSAENFIVTITLGRAEKYDILCVSPSNRTYRISVKTGYRDNAEFPLSQKDELGGMEDFYYAFILLNEFKTEPDFWIIPSIRVNEVLKLSANIYFKQKTKKDGTPHKDVGIRNLWLRINKTSRDLYPPDWEEELKQYYKNIEQLKKR